MAVEIKAKRSQYFDLQPCILDTYFSPLQAAVA